VAVGVLIAGYATEPPVFLLLPAWLAMRMALNAIDGMLAREFSQKSRLGAYLNELGDVISDVALYAPFALVPPLGALATGSVIVLALLTEFAGVLGPFVGASRRYDGPLGKSDRALVAGALGFWIGIGGALPAWFAWLMPLLAVLLIATVANRVRAGLDEAAGRADG
jgi:CDP-diacylglycerol--glycerol-3-phosphate 3-phosphatidyltransferase